MAAAALTRLGGGLEGGPSSPSSSSFSSQHHFRRRRPARRRPCVRQRTRIHAAAPVGHPGASPPAAQTSRRAAVGNLAAAAAVFTFAAPGARSEEEAAENNGWWLTGPLPVPTVTNRELANKETGTRSFLRNGIYMAKVGTEGSSYRLRQCAFDLLALEDLLVSGPAVWNYASKYLCLKSTFMYHDFDRVISAAPVDQRMPLLHLASGLFDSLEKLEGAIKKKDEGMVRSYYAETTPILREVRAAMA